MGLRGGGQTGEGVCLGERGVIGCVSEDGRCMGEGGSDRTRHIRPLREGGSETEREEDVGRFFLLLEYW